MSILRLVLTGVLVYRLVNGTFNGIVLLFCLGCITDFLDGYLARRFHWQTKVGAILDPLADKLFIGGLFYVLGFGLQLFPAWLVMLIIGRDLLIVTGVVALHASKRLTKIAPSFISKFNTALQMLLIFAGLLFVEYGIAFPELLFLIILVAVTTVMSLWGYSRHLIKILHRKSSLA